MITKTGEGYGGFGLTEKGIKEKDCPEYLSFVKETESRLQYAVLVELTAFYETVAGNLIAGTQDRILLLDAGGRTVVYQTAEGITAERIGDDARAAIQQEELDALLGCRDSPEPVTLFYQARATGQAKAYTARMAALPAAALLLAALGATPWPSRWMARLRRGTWTGKVVAVAEPLVLAALLMISTGYLVDGGVQPFWY